MALRTPRAVTPTRGRSALHATCMLALSTALAAALTACGGGGDTPAPDANAAAPSSQGSGTGAGDTLQAASPSPYLPLRRNMVDDAGNFVGQQLLLLLSDTGEVQ